MPAPRRRFTSLPAQVTAVLRDEIDKGTWSDWLPGERALTEILQVSRKTLRKALLQLHREGRITPIQGLGHRISGRKSAKRRASAAEPVVALLTPDPLERMRAFTTLWVNHLKSLLIENGVRLQTFDGRKFFSRQPAKALEKLAAQHSISGWLLANSTEATQRWFMERAIPCMIAGSCHPGIELPQVDLDHYALCRHAAGVLLGAGHRRVALLNERSGRAGDVESEAGFIAGVRESPHADAQPVVVRHEHSAESLRTVLQRLLEMHAPPTALLVSNGTSYLTVISALAQQKLRVPQDVSVISRDEEPFLDFLVPPPTRYSINPHLFAKKLLKPLLQSIRSEAVTPYSTRIIPAYMKGESLGPPNR